MHCPGDVNITKDEPALNSLDSRKTLQGYPSSPQRVAVRKIASPGA